MSKKKSLFQEKLVGLFLRLNGYVQTGLISHSDNWGDAGTDIDRIGIRFPNHSQTEREIDCSKKLMIPEKSIDIIIAEVKNKDLSFNEPLREKNKRAKTNWNQILNWLGLFKMDEIEILIPKMIDLVKKNGVSKNRSFEMVKHNNDFGEISIRPILFAIEMTEKKDNKLWINGNEIIEFVWKCLCPEENKSECSTRYDFNLWGSEYMDIVKYFKNHALKKPSLEELYDKFVN